MIRTLLLSTLLVASTSWTHADESYDPLQTAAKSATPVDLTLTDTERDRDVPIRIYLPPADEPAPLILLSHGLGGSRRACSYAANHWSARGYVVVAMQHIGTDESVWRDLPVQERMAALKAAPSGTQSINRYRDVAFVLDRLENLNAKEGHLLHELIDLDHVGMTGHSYGASTTQGVSGQSAPLIGPRFTDSRIDAALMFSPNRPARYEPAKAFGSVSIPWMLMTGTKDTSPINDTTVADRRAVYPALPETIDKFELVLHEAEHHAFGDENGRRRDRMRNPNHHRVIQALSTAFWDVYLRDDQEAAAWLFGSQPLELMEASDIWQLNRAKRDAD